MSALALDLGGHVHVFMLKGVQVFNGRTFLAIALDLRNLFVSCIWCNWMSIGKTVFFSCRGGSVGI